MRMKKLWNKAALTLAGGLLLGTTAAMASGMNCGSGKCGEEMKMQVKKADCGCKKGEKLPCGCEKGKCTCDKKKGAKCGDGMKEKAKGAMKCASGKCGGM